MISQFPDNWELINFFESEPEVLDPGSPWLFNTLEFRYRNRDERILARIRPSYGEFNFKYYRADDAVIDLELHWIDACRILKEREKEYMLLRFLPKARMKDFLLFLKPGIRCIGGNRHLEG